MNCDIDSNECSVKNGKIYLIELSDGDKIVAKCDKTEDHIEFQVFGEEMPFFIKDDEYQSPVKTVVAARPIEFLASDEEIRF